MELSKKELITILQAISALETAYQVTLSNESKHDGFGYWEAVGEALTIVCKALEK